MNKISVLIIVKDEPAIEKTLLALKPQVEGLQAECVVVDASEGRLNEIRDRNLWVNWIAYKQPSGRTFTIPHQRNVALNNSQGSNIFFCDSGYIPVKNWLATMNSALENSVQKMIGGPIFHRDGEKVIYIENHLSDGEEASIQTTANLGFKREIVSLLGGFDENFDYGSDADFILRGKDFGISHVVASGGILNVPSDPFRRDCKRFYRYGKARIRILSKHRKRIVTSLISSPDLILYPILWISPLALCISPSMVHLAFFVIGGVALNSVLYMKNRRNHHDNTLILKKYLYGLGMIVGLMRSTAMAIRNGLIQLEFKGPK